MNKQKINTGMLFERREKKFMVPPEKFHALLEALSPYMQADIYGLHTINTIYYDTDDYAIIRRSLDKPGFRQKLRLRSYGIPGPEDTVYLELKKKFSGITYKRRMGMTYRSARSYLEQGIVPAQSSENRQIYGEIDWFVSQQPLSAKVLLSYDRIALYGKEDEDFRMTFDSGIRWRFCQLDLSSGDHGSLLLAPGMRLLEVKIMGAFPLWLCRILSEFKLYSQSFSKYRTIYSRYLAVPDNQTDKEVLQIAG